MIAPIYAKNNPSCGIIRTVNTNPHCYGMLVQQPNYNGWWADWRAKRKAKRAERKAKRAERKAMKSGQVVANTSYIPPIPTNTASGISPIVYLSIGVLALGGTYLYFSK